MLLVAFAYRELNNAVPDSGTSFTWATKAFGPWVGWMGGWGLITATILVYYLYDHTAGLGLEQSEATALVGAYGAMLYLFTFAGTPEEPVLEITGPDGTRDSLTAAQ